LFLLKSALTFQPTRGDCENTADVDKKKAKMLKSCEELYRKVHSGIPVLQNKDFKQFTEDYWLEEDEAKEFRKSEYSPQVFAAMVTGLGEDGDLSSPLSLLEPIKGLSFLPQQQQERYVTTAQLGLVGKTVTVGGMIFDRNRKHFLA
jgi:hypothetical protein